MSILKSIVEFFTGKEETTVVEEQLVNVEQPKKIAKVVPLIDNELEYKDLQEKHSEFFNPESPTLQLQSKIGQKTSVSITDVTPSRSDAFFQNAPNVAPNNQEDFEKLEEYLGVNVSEEDKDFVETGDIFN